MEIFIPGPNITYNGLFLIGTSGSNDLDTCILNLRIHISCIRYSIKIHPFLLYLEAAEDIRDFLQENGTEYGAKKPGTDNDASLLPNHRHGDTYVHTLSKSPR